MSKSLGNVIAPQRVIEQSGADILRLWVATTDYTEDMRIGPEIVKGLVDNYRRLRNTLRYLLGNLNNFDEMERLPLADMPELERWVLHRLGELDVTLRSAVSDYSFHTFYSALHNFCATDLSAFYFDVRKDALYCDVSGSKRRRAARTVLDYLFNCLTAWLAPALPFTSEEAWLSRFPSKDDSVHLCLFPDLPTVWHDPDLAIRWNRVREIRRVVTGALEVERTEKRIGSSLEAAVHIYLTDPADARLTDTLDMAELAIASEVSSSLEKALPEGFRLDEVSDIAVTVTMAQGKKCSRCWQHLASVGLCTDRPGLCERCISAVGS